MIPENEAGNQELLKVSQQSVTTVPSPLRKAWRHSKTVGRTGRLERSRQTRKSKPSNILDYGIWRHHVALSM